MTIEREGSVVVIRFPPTSAQRLQINAEDTRVDDEENGRVPGRYGVSVLAMRPEPGETQPSTVDRMCKATTLGRRSKKIAVVNVTMLHALGFDIVSDPTDLEPHHHLIGVAPFQLLPSMEALASLLEDHRIDNPTWKKGSAA